MAVYLRDHPPRTQQFRCPRRRNPSGIIGVHTAESFADEDGHDSSAESVAAFIARRTNYGSYHLIVDSDSIIQLVDFGCVAYHIGTHGLNEHTIGISAAVQAHEWNDYGDDYEDAVLRNMARAAASAARWLQAEYGITVPSRRISLAQALNGERGFLAHGDADRKRRTDPGSQFKWSRFLSYYAAEMAGELEDTVSKKDVVEGINEGQGYASPYLAKQYGQNRETSLRWQAEWGAHYASGARGAARRARDLAAANAAKLDALMDAQQGVDLSGIKTHIDEHFEAAAAERADILALVEAVGTGERDAADVVDEIARRLSDAD